MLFQCFPRNPLVLAQHFPCLRVAQAVGERRRAFHVGEQNGAEGSCFDWIGFLCGARKL